MKKKTITIIAPAAVINTISLVVLPVSTQKILSQSIYLKSLKQTVTICLC